MMDDLDLISLSRTGKEEGGGEEGGHTSELPFGIYWWIWKTFIKSVEVGQ